MKYTILTEHHHGEIDSLVLFEEQKQKAKELGYVIDYFADDEYIHFFNSSFFDEKYVNLNIYDAIQSLALKDGIEFVQFENGRYGFVSFYSGEENGFEIISKVESKLWEGR